MAALFYSSLAPALLARWRIDFLAGLDRMHNDLKACAVTSVALNFDFV
jgi:hypothetical protein